MEKEHSIRIVYNIGQNQPDKRHISGLDALRTLAIVGVSLFHMFPDTIKGGYLGVSLFFVLTGYLLAYTSKNEWETGKFSLFHYYVKRIKRIYPSLIVVILVTVGVYHFLAPNVISAIRPEVTSVVLGYNNWWQIAQNADYFTRLTNTSPFTHLWFLGIELQYYLLWPVIFLVYTWILQLWGEKTGIGTVLILGLGAAMLMPMMYQPNQDVTRLYYGTDTRIYALLFGAAIGLYRDKRPQTMRIQPGYKIAVYGIFIVCLFATLIAYLMMDGQGSFTYQGGMLLMTIVFCILFYIMTDSSLAIGSCLDIPIFRWIAKRSYGIFLWQYPVIFLFNHIGWNKMPFYALLEMIFILLLTIWSDKVADLLIKRELPSISNRLVIAKFTVFLAITMGGVILMGYGCNGIAASTEHNTDTIELQARLKENIANLANQNKSISFAAEASETSKPFNVQQVNLDGAACIGDSVMLGASKELQQVLPNCYIDAEVSRYVGGGIDAAKNMETQEKLGNIVVIALGTNGPIAGAERYEVQTRELLEYLGPERHIFWVNVYCPDLKWQDTNNAYIEKIVSEHSNVKVVDWYSQISKHPEWLVKDGIHPNDEGTIQYAKLIHDRMIQVLAEQKPINL